MPDPPTTDTTDSSVRRSERAADPSALTTVVFDLGAVVLSWSPELAYQEVLPAAEVPAFLEAIDFFAWNRAQDAGRPFAEGEAQLIARFPERATAVRAYREHFARTLTGMVPGTGAVIAELEQAGIRLLALTNWSAETFPRARERFGLLDRFEDIVVSGAEGLAKPDPAIFRLLGRRFSVELSRCVFIDDSPPNVVAAAALGLTALHFTDAARLRAELVGLGLLGPRPPVTEPLFHLTERAVLEAARRAGHYDWSSRGLGYDAQGFVHCSYAGQVAGVAERLYADTDPADLVVLELDLGDGDTPVVVEEGEPGLWFPHLYAPLPLDRVVAEHPMPTFDAKDRVG
jgi:2-haloacid dehalogenase